MTLLSRRSLVAGASGLIASRALAYPMVGSASAPDPFTLPESGNGSFPGWNRTNTKTLFSSQALDGTKRNCLLLAMGQSNVCNVNPTSYVPTNSTKIANFNIQDGAAYFATGSQLGCTNWDAVGDYGNPILRVADTLISNNIFDFVWLLNIAIGGVAAVEWDTGSCSQRLRVLLLRLAAKGIPASAISAVLWGQGETDNAIATSQASYAATMNNIIAASRSLGVTAPWFIAKQTYYIGTTSSAVQAAQLALVNHGSGIWAGPDADSIGSGSRFDNIHFNDAGAATYATAWYNSLIAFGAPF